MRPFFRPMLTPTLWIVPLLAMLIALGVWQVHRLHWKLDLLAKIHTGLIAPPTSLADAWGYGSDYVRVSQADDADYRRVWLHGHFLNDREIYFFTTGSEGEPVYHVITPFVAEHPWQDARICSVCLVVVGADGKPLNKPNRRDVLILIDRGIVPLNFINPATRRAGEIAGSLTITGIIRKPAAPNWFTPPIDGAHRIVHTRDPATLAKAFGLRNVFPMFLEADATPNPGGWPRGGVTIVDLPNDHLQYAITWFGLALSLFVVYLAYHHSKGRLGFKK